MFELLQYPGISTREEQHIKSLLNICMRVPVSDAIAERAAFLARTHRIGVADLLIAATALELGVPLFTKNIRDFKKIPELETMTSLD